MKTMSIEMIKPRNKLFHQIEFIYILKTYIKIVQQNDGNNNSSNK